MTDNELNHKIMNMPFSWPKKYGPDPEMISKISKMTDSEFKEYMMGIWEELDNFRECDHDTTNTQTD